MSLTLESAVFRYNIMADPLQNAFPRHNAYNYRMPFGKADAVLGSNPKTSQMSARADGTQRAGI